MREIKLPFPNRALHPNARVHWAKRASETKRHRLLAYSAALKVDPEPFSPVSLAINIYPPNRRGHDLDGIFSASKAYIDGVADAWKFNDRAINTVHLHRCDVVSGGLLEFIFD